MASRGWVRSIITATLVAAGCGAAQLGLGYGLGIIAWFNTTEADRLVTHQGAWTASLAWATWTAATSVIGGAICGDRAGGTVESGLWGRLAWRAVIALAAAIGALITVPLVALPARAAQLSNNFAPDLLAGVYAMSGVVIGLLVALAAITSRAVAANVIATSAWLWTLAVIAVVDGVATGRGLASAQLAIWRFTDSGPYWQNFYVPGALLMVGAALLIGGLAALPAARRGDNRVGVVLSGAMGPLLVAGAYFLAAPPTALRDLYSAFLTAPYAVLAGLAGSVLIGSVVLGAATAGGPAPDRPDRHDDQVGEPGTTDPATSPVPRPPAATGIARVTPVAEPYGDTAPGQREPEAATPAGRRGKR